MSLPSPDAAAPGGIEVRAEGTAGACPRMCWTRPATVSQSTAICESPQSTSSSARGVAISYSLGHFLLENVWQNSLRVRS